MQENVSPHPPPPVDSSATYLLDTTIFILKDVNLSTGVFHYSVSSQNPPDFKKGDYFIEPRNFGYLRKIDDINKVNGDLYFNTEQATIYDAFKRYGDFSGTFSIPGSLNPFSNKSRHVKQSVVGTNSTTKTNGSSTILGVFPDFTISSPGLDVSIKSLGLSLDPVFTTRFDLKNKSFALGIDSANFSCGYYASLQKTNVGNLDLLDTFHVQDFFPADISKMFTRVPIQVTGPNGLPIIGDISIDMLFVRKYDGSKAVNDVMAFSQQRVLSMNASYQNGNLGSNFQFPIQYNDVFYNSSFNNNNGVDASFSLIPVLKISFYNVPVINISLTSKSRVRMESNQDATSWDEIGVSGLQGSVDFNNNIFGFFPNAETHNTSNEPVDTIYRAPANILSTNQDSANAGDNIPFTVQLVDSRGSSLMFPTTVFYSSDIGSWDNTQVFSGSGNGVVTNNFTVADGVNHIQLAVKDGQNNTLISYSNTLVSDTATTGAGLGLYAVGPYAVPGIIPGFMGNGVSAWVASGKMIFSGPGVMDFDVKILDSLKANLYSAHATLAYPGHDPTGPIFRPADSTYPGAQYYPGQGWGCVLPAGIDTWFNIGNDVYFCRRTGDGIFAIMLPVGYCLFR